MFDSTKKSTEQVSEDTSDVPTHQNHARVEIEANSLGTGH